MPSKFYHPRYWFIWMGIGLLWLISHLPWSWQMFIGKGLGKLLYLTISKRRRVSCINLQIAFPELDDKQLIALNKAHFISIARALMDSALSWWGSKSKVASLTHIEGMEHLEKARKEGNVMLVGAHFTSLEMGGRIVAAHVPIDTVYRPHQNDLLEYIVAKKRAKQYGKTIPKSNIRQMLKSIKSGNVAWYATDQNYRLKGSILVPFFGEDAPTNPSTARIAKMTKAQVIPIFTMRLYGEGNKKGDDNRSGYLLRILPPVADFPSGDEYQDTLRLNRIIEEQIKEFPEQYLWSHERYKFYQSENRNFYKDYIAKHPDSICK